jgi:hypothetical protein
MFEKPRLNPAAGLAILTALVAPPVSVILSGCNSTEATASGVAQSGQSAQPAQQKVEPIITGLLAAFTKKDNAGIEKALGAKPYKTDRGNGNTTRVFKDPVKGIEEVLVLSIDNLGGKPFEMTVVFSTGITDHAVAMQKLNIDISKMQVIPNKLYNTNRDAKVVGMGGLGGEASGLEIASFSPNGLLNYMYDKSLSNNPQGKFVNPK